MDIDSVTQSIVNHPCPRHHTCRRCHVRGNVAIASAHYGLPPEVFTQLISVGEEYRDCPGNLMRTTLEFWGFVDIGSTDSSNISSPS